jgi:hypothetical protein
MQVVFFQKCKPRGETMPTEDLSTGNVHWKCPNMVENFIVLFPDVASLDDWRH